MLKDSHQEVPPELERYAYSGGYGGGYGGGDGGRRGGYGGGYGGHGRYGGGMTGTNNIPLGRG